MNPLPVQTPAEATADSIQQMQDFNALLKSQMSEADYAALMTPYQLMLQKVMDYKKMVAIEACEIIMNQLDDNLALDEDTRELQKALYLIVANDMMGSDFINSLTQ